MLRSALKLTFAKSRMKRNHFESSFGPYPQKYEEFFHWFVRALESDGDILEFGVAKGGTTSLMAEKLLQRNLQKRIHAFDSFHGFDDDEFTACLHRGDVRNAEARQMFRTSEESRVYVERKLRAFGFSAFVRLHEGFFQQTLPHFLAEDRAACFCFALIDCDLADSVEFCAESIYNHMVPGGVILFDDYGSLTPGKQVTAFSEGVKRVVDLFIARYGSQTHGYVNGLYHFVK